MAWSPLTTRTMLSARYTATRTTAIVMASRKPFRKIAPSTRSRTTVTGTGCVEPRWGEWVLDEVRRGVCRRQRDRDDEAGGGEAQQAEHDDLALPSREQILEHEDAALTVRAHLRDAVVHGQRAEQRQQHEDERRDRRQGAGGDERDAWLIRERRKIVHARQAHHLPPGRRVGGADMRSDRFFIPFVHPVVEAALRRQRGDNGPGSGVQDFGNLP